ncbi:MAG: ABC transporter substrate-binding protein, partial [Sphingobacteriaceae bacterium]
DYATTPAKKLETGLADFAIAPFESVISLNNKASKVNAVAVAALLQNDISSVVTLSSGKITRPKELDNHSYASYQARYEDAIVKQMIINDGGTGNIEISYPKKLGIWDTLLTNKADATWIFNNWEGVEAETKNIRLNKFALADYGIPYAYSPVLFSTQEKISSNTDTYKAFLKATKKGFQAAISNQAQAVEILSKYLSKRDIENVDIAKSQAFAANFYGDAALWGTMDDNRIKLFLNWLIKNKLENEIILSQKLYTNELLG